MGGGGGAKPVKKPVRKVTAQPVAGTMSEAESRNTKLAAALLTQGWNEPPKLGVSTLQNKGLLGL